MGMVGIRGDVFVVAPAASFHHHHHHHGHPHDQILPSSSEHPIIPLLPSAPTMTLIDDPSDNIRLKPATGINLWQQQQQQQQQQHQSVPSTANNPGTNLSYLRKPVPILDTGGMLASGTTTCQDCGNQAKKDCSHRRCRTCCKSRGFECSTHVKSTWVPAARRRERLAAFAGSSTSTSGTKRPKLISSTNTTASHTSTSNTSLDTSSSQQDVSFRENLPVHVRAPAVFKCVRVTSIDNDGEDEYAYQGMVKINGHVFKGFLYDQGIDENASAEADNNNNNNGSNILNISELHLSGNSGAGGGGSGSHHVDVFGSGSSSGAGLLGGGGGGGSGGGVATGYGNPIN